jgi:hypothetical protein
VAQEKVIPQAMYEFLKRSESAEKLSGISSQIFFAALIIASLLLIFSVFLPRPREVGVMLPRGFRGLFARMAGLRIFLSTSSLVALLLLCALTKQLNIDGRRGFIEDQERRYDAQVKRLAYVAGSEEALRAQYLYMPEGQSLKYMTLNNPSLAADYLWLTSLQYVSNSFRRGQKFGLLLRFYNTIQELDPHWIDAISNGGKVLSAVEPDRLAVEKFYFTASINNPKSWRLRYEAGRMFVVPPLNLDMQKEYAQHALNWFNDALRLLKWETQTPAISQAIRDINEIAGRMALEADYYDAAEEMLYKQATDPKNDVMLRKAAAQDLLTARTMVLIVKVQKKLDEFKAIYGAYPQQLNLLFMSRRDPILGVFSKGDSSFVDVDAFGFKLEYDPQAGKVSSRGVKARQANQAAAIVNGMIENFRGVNKRLPHDLFELQTFTYGVYAAPNEPPTANITDAIGRDLNVTMSPLGVPWEFDKVFGVVTVPSFCKPENLYRNAEKFLNGSR